MWCVDTVKKNRSFPPERDVFKPSTDQDVVVLVKKKIVHSVVVVGDCDLFQRV